MSKILLFVQLASTLAMAGIIWLVQIVHYPLFQFVGGARYKDFHQAHMNWISYVVAPTMIVEALSAGLLFFYPLPNLQAWQLWTGACLIVIIWASTFFVQVPLHEKLVNGFDSDAHRALVNTNWIRTIAWTLRACLALWFVWNFARSS